MENKISIQRLASMLAIETGKQKKLCEDFIKEIFRIVADELANGENVRIKGFGTFKLVKVEARKSVNVATGEQIEIPGHSKVIFVAAKEVASAVNTPFEAFEAVEISDEIPTDAVIDNPEPDGNGEYADDDYVIDENDPIYDYELEEASDQEELSEVATQEVYEYRDREDTPAETVENEGDNRETENDIPQNEDQDSAGERSEENASSGTGNGCETEEIETINYPIDLYRHEEQPRHRYLWGFAAGFLAAVLALGISLFIWGPSYINKEIKAAVKETLDKERVETPSKRADASRMSGSESERSVETPAVTSEERTETNVDEGTGDGDVPTAPSDSPVYDTVSTTRYLTTIAKEHYGNFNLWPLIYEANKDILGHPDRIRPGTKVVVPPLSKTGIDPHNPADVKKVKQKGLEIYAKYK
nr:hypothetical protein Muribac2_220 [uncultured Muribaculaceae bacterium]